MYRPPCLHKNMQSKVTSIIQITHNLKTGRNSPSLTGAYREREPGGTRTGILGQMKNRMEWMERKQNVDGVLIAS